MCVSVAKMWREEPSGINNIENHSIFNFQNHSKCQNYQNNIIIKFSWVVTVHFSV